MKRMMLACVLTALVALSTSATAADRPSSWSAPTAEEVKAQLDSWLPQQKLSDEQKQQVEALWTATGDGLSGSELLDRVATTLAAVHPEAKTLVNFCREPRTSAPLPEFKVLSDETLPPLVRHNLRLVYGAWLARHDMHEEALAQFEGLTPNDVVDPAALLFYSSVCHHRLRDKDACLPAIAKLLENEAAVPRRFRELAQLMQADLEPLEADTLDEVARLMDSVRRRLELARVGKRVRDEEDQVIAKLDKMIDELEQQRQQQQAQASGNPQGGNPSSPLPDSRAAGGRGKGDVDPKDLQDNGNWGNLPPRERQEALQQISKELPAHYREAIEEYFRKLARESDR